MPMSQPIEIICKILNSRDQASEKQEQRTKQQTGLLAAALTSGGPMKTEQGKVLGNKSLGHKGLPDVGLRQCAYCKQEVH